LKKVLSHQNIVFIKTKKNIIEKKNILKMNKDLVSRIIENSSWKKEPDFIEEYQLGCQEYIVCYNIDEEATQDTHDTQGTAMELSIERLFIKGYDINDNEVVFDITDYYFEYPNENCGCSSSLMDYLYEAHIERHGE